MRIEFHPLMWYLNPIKDEGYISTNPGTPLRYSKIYTFLFFTIYRY